MSKLNQGAPEVPTSVIYCDDCLEEQAMVQLATVKELIDRPAPPQDKELEYVRMIGG